MMKKLLTLMLPAFVLCGCSSNSGVETASSRETREGLTSQQTVSPGDSHTLVTYFSVTNHTEKLANYAKEHLQSDIFEIVAKQEYTAEDINYNTDCRANREQNDDSARPEILYTIEDISQYDTIVLGYPIWWGQAPKILYTFIESYDFSNKTILPFCTSGSSPIGSSALNLAKSAPEANWLEGRRFSASASKDEIGDWLDGYINKEETMKLTIDDKELDVAWEDNDSVAALKALTPLTIAMHEYGGFEQTGPIGTSIARNDKQINVVPSDIVLYSGNAISVFYENSAWSYTRLGHINASKTELNELLNKPSVTFVLKG
ncbi:MAG: NAD(P)H-dependent oxidoreductase [Bacilli bacterium]|nr:NAD(P)H-dependent oxidoreductase [Bacilli bacterium]